MTDRCIEVSTEPTSDSGYLTESELELGKIYLSCKQGSRGFLFVKMGDSFNPKVIAFSKDTCMYPSSGHGRDFYLAPKGTFVTIKNK